MYCFLKSARYWCIRIPFAILITIYWNRYIFVKSSSVVLISDHFPKMVNKFPAWKKNCLSMHFDSLLNARLYSFYFWTTKFVFIFRIKFCAVYLVHFCTTWILVIICTQSAFHTAILLFLVRLVTINDFPSHFQIIRERWWWWHFINNSIVSRSSTGVANK